MIPGKKYTHIKKVAFFLVLMMISFIFYVMIATSNSKNMTVRQKILKAVYPIFMWYTGAKGTNAASKSNSSVMPKVSLYPVPVTLINGKALDLNDFKGKKILLVNTASDCGYTGQYESLEKLYQDHKESLVVLGFPSNDFKEQEKGSDEAIEAFCKINFGVTFPLVKKSKVVKGSGQNEVFQWLTDKDKNGWNDRSPKWNFCKYLVNEKGTLIRFFKPSIDPLGKEVLEAIAEK